MCIRDSPQTDPLISAHYSAEDLCGKRTCKENLLAELGLPPEARDAPLIGVISRFAQQKGTDLIADTAAEIVAEGCYLAVSYTHLDVYKRQGPIGATQGTEAPSAITLVGDAAAPHFAPIRPNSGAER